MIGTVLLDPNECAWFENPGAIGARNSLIACGARLIPVPVDQDGLVVEEGLRQASQFRLAFVTPSHQQPLGVSMSLDRRYALLQAAENAKARRAIGIAIEVDAVKLRAMAILARVRE